MNNKIPCVSLCERVHGQLKEQKQRASNAIIQYTQRAQTDKIQRIIECDAHRRAHTHFLSYLPTTGKQKNSPSKAMKSTELNISRCVYVFFCVSVKRGNNPDIVYLNLCGSIELSLLYNVFP